MLDVQRDGSVARLFLDRPAKANALGSELLDRLQALDETTARVFIGAKRSTRNAPTQGAW